MKEMEYRRLFVCFTRPEKSSLVNVTLDGTHLTSFYCEALTQEAFDAACDAFVESEQYEKAKEQF